MGFGTYFKKKRKETGLTLRQFCENKGLDAAYISRLENGIISPPRKRALIKSLATAIKIKEGSSEWVRFFDLAATSRGEFPKDIKENFPSVIKYLPAFLRSVKKKKIKKKDIEKLIKLIKNGYTLPNEEK